jgi:hypothetical protein
VVERVPKTAPKGVAFCHFFTGTETYPVIFAFTTNNLIWLGPIDEVAFLTLNFIKKMRRGNVLNLHPSVCVV